MLMIKKNIKEDRVRGLPFLLLLWLLGYPLKEIPYITHPTFRALIIAVGVIKI